MMARIGSFMGMPNPWLIVAFLAALAGTGYQGYRMGKSDCEAAHNAAMLEALEEGEKLKNERRELETQIDTLARELEREANEDPIVVTQCLGPSRVRRLQSIR